MNVNGQGSGVGGTNGTTDVVHKEKRIKKSVEVDDEKHVKESVEDTEKKYVKKLVEKNIEEKIKWI